MRPDKKNITAFLTAAVVSISGSGMVHASQQGAHLDNIIVHPGSDRSYRAISLDNGLRAVLIHDQDTDKAAASLDVLVGSANDPESRQGMAHFLEHMLFLGTEPYPTAGDYQAYLSANGGSSNAYTTYDHTNYFFDVDASQLKGALDRFAPFFSTPLFTPDLVERERNAVHSEYTSKIQDDGRRYFDALKQIVNPEHPFAKFTVGNLSTLNGENLAQEVRTFWQENYSANLMSLAVIGPQPLDQLERWVRERFSTIPNYQYDPIEPQRPLFTQEDLPSQLEVNSLRDRRSLTLMFPIPEVESLYRIKPTSYLGGLIGHEGEGSWFAQLRAQGWAESLSAGLGISHSDGAAFMVSIELTPEGRERIDDIVEMGFAHLHLIEQQGIEQWRHQEQGQLLQNEFVFLADGPVRSHATSMARAQQRYPTEDLIRGAFAWDAYDPDLLQDFVTRLTPDNMILSYSGPDVTSTRQSPWYQTPFKQAPVAESRLTQWRAARAGQGPLATALPEPNPFIADQFALIREGQIDGQPEIIRQAPGITHWHLSDAQFEQPRADIYLRFSAQSANASPSASVAGRMIARLVKDQLNTQTYPALVAGLGFDVYRTLSGITVLAKGYNQTAPELAAVLVQAMSQPKIDADVFALIQNDIVRELKNQALDAPYERLMQRLPSELIQGYWSREQQLMAAESMTPARVMEHWQRILDSAALDLLTHGNLTPGQAESIGTRLTDMLQVSQPMAATLPAIQAPSPGTRWTQETDHTDQAWVAYWSESDPSPEQEARLRLLAQMVKTPFYTDLRTERQLGYIVFAGYMPMLTQPGVVFTVQSPEASPDQIEAAAFEFFTQFEDDVDTMTQAQFSEFKNSVLTDLTEEDPNLSARSSRFWRSIGLKDFAFDRRDQVVAAIEQLTLSDMREMARRLARGEAFIYLNSGGAIQNPQAALGR